MLNCFLGSILLTDAGEIFYTTNMVAIHILGAERCVEVMGLAWKLMLIFVLAIVILVWGEIRGSRNSGGQKQHKKYKEPIQALGDWPMVIVLMVVAIICVMMVI